MFALIAFALVLTVVAVFVRNLHQAAVARTTQQDIARDLLAAQLGAPTRRV